MEQGVCTRQSAPAEDYTTSQPMAVEPHEYNGTSWTLLPGNRGGKALLRMDMRTKKLWRLGLELTDMAKSVHKKKD